MLIADYEVYSTIMEQEFIAIFECFSLNKFYMLRDKLLIAKNTKNKQNGPIDIYIWEEIIHQLVIVFL